MNKKDQKIFEQKELNKFGIFGGSYHSRRAKNALYSHRNPKDVTDIHEYCKFQVWLELIRKGHMVISEAWRRGSNPPVIRDIHDCTTGYSYEVETEKTRMLRHTDPNVIALHVDEFKTEDWKDNLI